MSERTPTLEGDRRAGTEVEDALRGRSRSGAGERRAAQRETPWRTAERGPFDVVGDVHGCARTLGTLGAYGHNPEREQYSLAKAIAGLTLIGCADTHRRNVGVQHVWGAEGEKVVLAPLYDCSSIEGTEWRSAKRMVIPIGGATWFDEVGQRHWRRLAEASKVPTTLILEAGREVARKLPDAIREAARTASEDDRTNEPGARNRRIETIEKHTIKRCGRTLRELGTVARTREKAPDGRKQSGERERG